MAPHDHTDAGAVHESELTQVHDSQPRATEGLVKTLLQFRSAGEIQFTTDPHPGTVAAAVAQRTIEDCRVGNFLIDVRLV